MQLRSDAVRCGTARAPHRSLLKADGITDEQLVEAAALAESLNRFLESLPQEKRVLFVRRYWYLCSVEELAAWSGRRRGTVSAALFRLRQDLREHLEREGFTL